MSRSRGCDLVFQVYLDTSGNWLEKNNKTGFKEPRSVLCGELAADDLIAIASTDEKICKV